MAVSNQVSDMTKQPLVTLRPMTAADIPAGMALKNSAGWNQSVRDWRMIFNASQGGSYVAVIDKSVIGTITTITYSNRFSWLGMLLVTPEYRRQGIGTMLMKSAIYYAKDYGAIFLDATPAGVPLYRSLGFVALSTLIRMERQGNAGMVVPSFAQPLISANTLQAVCTYDEPIFGADRCSILIALFYDAPHYGFVAPSHPIGHTAITGYCLGRCGSHFEQLGPIVADNVEIAQALVSTALKDYAHKNVIVDIPTANSQWMGWLEQQGFVKRREFTRMVLGVCDAFGQPEKHYAIAGPEIG